MRKALSVGSKEVRQILRDRRTLATLLVVPAVFLLIYGYALNWDIRHIGLAVDDRDRSPASRALVSAFVNSGYFDFAGDARSDADVDRLMNGTDVRAVLVIPSGLDRDVQAGRIVPVYRLTAGLTAARLRSAMREALDRAGNAYPEYLPQDVRVEAELEGIAAALEAAHYPPSFEARDAALRRL